MRAKTLAVAAGAVALAAALAIFATKNLPWSMVSSGEAVQRRQIAMQVLGEELSRSHPGKSALVMANPFAQEAGHARDIYAFQSAAIAGLREGLGKHLKLTAVVFPELRPEARQDPGSVPIDPDSTTPLSFLTAPGSWDTLFRKHADVDLIVSLIGLPADLRQLELWRQPKPALALLLPDLRMVGPPDEVRKALRSGKLAAIVFPRPGAPAESQPLERDLHAEFAKRFVLVTRVNWEQVAATFPALF